MSDIPRSLSGDRPAFPVADEVGTFHGLTKREYFAALAMQGILTKTHVDGRQSDFRDVAHDAVCQADALMAQLNK